MKNIINEMDEFFGLNKMEFVSGLQDELDRNTNTILREIENDMKEKRINAFEVVDILDILPEKERKQHREEMLKKFGEEKLLEKTAKAFSEDKFFCLESAVEKIEKLSKLEDSNSKKSNKKKEGISM